MKLGKILAASLLSVGLLTGCVLNQTAIIKVNGEPITKAEFDKEFNKQMQNPQITQMGPQAKEKDGFMALMTKDRVVNELIVKKILDQQVKKHNITVSDDEIKAKKAEIIDKIGSEEKFNELIKQNNISDKQLKEDLTNEIKVNKLVEATSDVKVSDKEVQDFYNKNKQSFNYPERVRASHILIEANPDAIKQQLADENAKNGGKLSAAEIDAKVKETLDKKMALAKEVRQKVLNDPKQFASLAKQYSDDKGSAKKGGDLGFFPREAMVKPFSDAAFKLKPNTVSEIVVSEFGNHIIIVTDRAQAGLQPLDSVKDEIKAYLEQSKKIAALQKLFDGLKSSAKVEYIDSSYNPVNIQEQLRKKVQEQQNAPQAPQQAGMTPVPAAK